MSCESESDFFIAYCYETIVFQCAIVTVLLKPVGPQLVMGRFIQNQSNPICMFTTYMQSNPIHKYHMLNRTRK